MTLRQGARHAVAAVGLVSLPYTVCAQVSSLSLARFPASVPVSDVEIRLVTGGGDGCQGRCVNHRITVHGGGLVELEDIGSPPRDPTRRRSIPSDQVVALVNEALKAGFLDAPDRYDSTLSAFRKGDTLVFQAHGGSAPWVEITMRFGSFTKTVRLQENVPSEIDALKARLFSVGGPQAWSAK